MDGGLQRRQDKLHSQNVEHTLAELERAVNDHKAALNQLREGMEPPRFRDDAAAAQASLELMAQAYDNVTKSEPFLPFARSVLPALLVMRKTHQTIAESKAYLKSQGVSLDNARKRLEIERANLADQNALQVELEKRIQSLRETLETGKTLTAEEVFQNRMLDLKQQTMACKQDRKQIMKDLGQFIREHLGRQLAQEQAGGPVVGDLMELDSDGADAGQNAGQPLQSRKRKHTGDDQTEDTADDQASAAAEELQELVENLLSASAERPQAYIAVKQGSVAAIFLVRSKVAQFHPQDSTRLRLVDFGREFVD